MHCEATDQQTDPQIGEMETLSTAMTRFGETGFRGQYLVRGDSVACETCGSRTKPGSVVVHDVFRYEGMSDPDDESVLFALQGSCGHRGTLVAAYGPDTSAEEAAVMSSLPERTG